MFKFIIFCGFKYDCFRYKEALIKDNISFLHRVTGVFFFWTFLLPVWVSSKTFIVVSEISMREIINVLAGDSRVNKFRPAEMASTRRVHFSGATASSLVRPVIEAIKSHQLDGRDCVVVVYVVVGIDDLLSLCRQETVFLNAEAAYDRCAAGMRSLMKPSSVLVAFQFYPQWHPVTWRSGMSFSYWKRANVQVILVKKKISVILWKEK